MRDAIEIARQALTAVLLAAVVLGILAACQMLEWSMDAPV